VEVLDGEVRPARCSAGGTCYITRRPCARRARSGTRPVWPSRASSIATPLPR
jgi:hypothetical protein